MSKNPYFWHLIPLNPRIKIFFQNSGRVTFFTLLTPNFMQSFRKIEWAVSEIFKDGRTNGLTDGRTDGRTRAITKDPLGRTRGPKMLTKNTISLHLRVAILKNIFDNFDTYLKISNAHVHRCKMFHLNFRSLLVSYMYLVFSPMLLTCWHPLLTTKLR